MLIFETDRLYLRELTQADYRDLCEILQDEKVMYAYEHAFTATEVQDWLDKQLTRYKKDGFGLWAVVDRETNSLLGQCGLTLQNCEGEELLEIGYLFKRKYWHQGYATEAAIGCKEYAFAILKQTSVYSIIRDTNLASQQVAKRNGMRPIKNFVKHYNGIEMPHVVFQVTSTKNN